MTKQHTIADDIRAIVASLETVRAQGTVPDELVTAELQRVGELVQILTGPLHMRIMGQFGVGQHELASALRTEIAATDAVVCCCDSDDAAARTDRSASSLRPPLSTSPVDLTIYMVIGAPTVNDGVWWDGDGDTPLLRVVKDPSGRADYGQNYSVRDGFADAGYRALVEGLKEHITWHRSGHNQTREELICHILAQQAAQSVVRESYEQTLVNMLEKRNVVAPMHIAVTPGQSSPEPREAIWC